MSCNTVIFISMHLPSLNVPEAGQKIAYDNLMEFISKGKNVILISFYNDLEEKYLDKELYALCSEVYLFKVSLFSRLIGVLKNFTIPSVVAYRMDVRVNSLIKKQLRKFPDALVHVEYEQGAEYIPKSCINNSVVFHDVISQSFFRFYDLEKNPIKKYFLKIKYLNVKNWEKSILKNIVKKVIVLNEKDKKILVDQFGVDQNIITINYPKVSECFYKCKHSNRNPKNLIFWGAMNREENIDAVLWFAKEIYPQIITDYPDIKIYIVGANPDSRIKSLENENFIVTGFVEDPIQYFENCSICIVPLRFGAGIKIKVLEALAAQLHVVTTTVGAEGVHDAAGLMTICDEPTDFANALINLLNLQTQKYLLN